MARRRGVVMNLKKVYRLYKEEGLTVRRRGGRKRAIGTRAPLEKAARPNAIWVLDFVSDTLESGRRFRVFNVEDQFTRRGLGVEVDTSLPGRRIVRVLDRLVADLGQAGDDRLRQRHGTDLQRDAEVDDGDGRSSGTTSRRASRCRTATWRASTASSATSA